MKGLLPKTLVLVGLACAPLSTPAPLPLAPSTASWTHRFGGSGIDRGSAVAVDEAGQIALAGTFERTADFAGRRRTSEGGADVFVTLLASDGRVLWARRAGGAADDVAGGVDVDRRGDVVVTGSFAGKADFAGQPMASAGGLDCFVAKLSRFDGRVLWLRTLGGQGSEVCRSVALDSSGDAVVTGELERAFEVGKFTLISHGASDVLLFKVSGRDGSVLWVRRMGGQGGDAGRTVSFDSEGNMLVAGSFSAGVPADEGSVDFGRGALLSHGDADAFVAKYAPSGGLIWAHRIGSAGPDLVESTRSSPRGDLYLCGIAAGVPDRGMIRGPSGPARSFIARYAPWGEELWLRSLDGVSGDCRVNVDKYGGLWLLSRFVGALALGPGLQAAGSTDVVLAAFDRAGDSWTAKRFGSPSPDTAGSLAFDTTGRLVVTGMLEGDIFVARQLPPGP